MKRNKIINAINITLFIISAFFIFASIYIEDVWDMVSIEQIMITLHSPVFQIGTNLKRRMFIRGYQLGWIFLVVILVYILPVLKVKNIIFRRISIGFILVFTISTFFYLDNKFSILEYRKDSIEFSAFIEDNYEVDRSKVTWNKKNNLVFIIAESLENTFSDDTIFTPPPRKLCKQTKCRTYTSPKSYSRR